MTLARARSLRRSMTAAEARLWRAIRNRQLAGVKFVRQWQIGPYYADFCARLERIVVEIDGATHSTEEEIRRDVRRTDYLARAGFRVLRFHNAEVFETLDAVLETIRRALPGQE